MLGKYVCWRTICDFVVTSDFFANVKFYKEKKNTLSECQCILHESTTWGHYFDGTAILCGHPSHAKV